MKNTSNDRRLDRTNLRILEHLSRNGRMSYSDISGALQCSINTVRDRIFAMERRGVIQRYEATVDEARLGRHLRCMVMLEPDQGMKRPAELKKALQELAAVHRAELSTGPHTLMLEMLASDMGSLHEQIRKEIYPLGFRSARVVLLGPEPRTAAEDGHTEGIVADFRRSTEADTATKTASVEGDA